jgi:hypothetical protein
VFVIHGDRHRTIAHWFHMSETQWTQENFVQLARRSMLSTECRGEIAQRLLEFFSDALIHYENATDDGKAYIDRAMSGLSKLFEEEPNDPDAPATPEMRSCMASLRVLHDGWQNKRFGAGFEN